MSPAPSITSPPQHAAYRRDHHREYRHGRTLHARSGRHRAAQRLDAVRRRRRVRLRRRDRHRHRQAACARPGRRRATDELQVRGARRRPDAGRVVCECMGEFPPVSSRVRTPMVAAGQRVGIMGGSFNPAHDGHRIVAETAVKRLRPRSALVARDARQSSEGELRLTNSIRANDCCPRLCEGAAHEGHRVRGAAGLALHRRDARLSAAAISGRAFRLGDGRRQSGRLQPLAEVATDLPDRANRRGGSARIPPRRARRTRRTALRRRTHG